MDTILFLTRLLLTGVFLVAAVTKLVNPAGSARAMKEFGLPSRLARPLGYALPLAELVVAALLLFVSPWWGGLGALALLLLFNAAIALNLVKGRRPDCHCFGQLHSTPVGWKTLLRNVLFALGAGFVVWQGGDAHAVGFAGLVNDLSAFQLVALLSITVLAGALAAAAWVIIHLLRQNGRLLLRVDLIEARLSVAGIAPGLFAADAAYEGLPVGSPAPSFELPLLSGQRVTLDDLREEGKPALLIFSDADCVPCNALLPEVVYWERQHAPRLTIALVSRGSLDANRAKADAYGLKNVLLQQDREVMDKYQVRGTPSGILIQADGSIGTPTAVGPQAIMELVARVTGTGIPTPLPVVAGNGHRHHGAHAALPAPAGLKPGEASPSLSLPDLSGRMVELSQFKGRETLLLFWNPGCGFCNQMLPELKALEDGGVELTRELLIISTGSVEANRAMGLRSTVLLDQSFSAGRAFGVAGTPAAVLVNAAGHVASQVAVGAPAVLTLAST